MNRNLPADSRIAASCFFEPSRKRILTSGHSLFLFAILQSFVASWTYAQSSSDAITSQTSAPLTVTKSAVDELKILKVTGDEPLAPQYSLGAAIEFMDRTSMAWTNQRKCFTCHTNFLHLVASVDLEKRPPRFKAIEDALLEMVTQRWKTKGPRWDAEVVMSAVTLAMIDHRQKKLRAPTRMALDRMWTAQREDGGFDWLKCGWPPMESDDFYGAAIAAVGVSATPDEYWNQQTTQASVKKLKTYLASSKESRLHHQAMLLWAEKYRPGWLTQTKRDSIVASIKKLQRPDGGWNTPSLGDWDRLDGKQPDKETSDGYGTGFAVFVLQAAGEKPESPEILQGIKWLKENQRQSGRWYTRSTSRDNKHFLTHAGTAMAIMALRSNQIDRMAAKPQAKNEK